MKIPYTFINRGITLTPQYHAWTLLTCKHGSFPFFKSISSQFLVSPRDIRFLFTNLGSLQVPEKGASTIPICVAFHRLLINLPPFADSFVSSTRNRFQLFMPIFHKYLGDGISKQTMRGDTNPRLQQRSFNALEIWPAVDRHLLLSSAASQQQC